ncbi:MAG: hypothetical protein V8T36_04920 [Ruthenibacterium lactatiformans]
MVIFLAVLTLYDAMIASMFDPKLNATLDDARDDHASHHEHGRHEQPGRQLPGGFLTNYLYGFLMLIFPLVFSALAANRLVARHVDRGSMAYLLAAPNSRARVAFTQTPVLITGVTAIIAVCTALGRGLRRRDVSRRAGRARLSAW